MDMSLQLCPAIHYELFQIPDLADSHNRNRYETDQPKLLLADDGVEGTEGKQPLNNEYNGRRGE